MPKRMNAATPNDEPPQRSFSLPREEFLTSRKLLLSQSLQLCHNSLKSIRSEPQHLIPGLVLILFEQDHILAIKVITSGRGSCLGDCGQTLSREDYFAVRATLGSA